jgi:EmrB/QacA subfamily drug resistance transporter
MSISNEAAPQGRVHHQATFAVLASSVAAFALLQSLVTPVLPTIQIGLHTSQNHVTWVLTVYLLSASIFTPIVGRLGDMLGKERVLVVTLSALAVGSLLAAVASSLTVMILGRVIQGVGGGVLPLAFGIIREEFPREKVVGAVGTIAALAAAGAGLGIVLAGPIVSALDFHWLFWIPMIALIMTAIAAKVVVPASRVRSEGKLNYLGAVLLAGWLVALLIGISEAPSWGWGSGRVLGLLVLAVVLAVTWAWSEARAGSPLIDLRMMRLPAVWTTNLVALLFGVGMYATFAFLPEFLQTPSSAGYGFAASVTESGLILLPSTVMMFALGILSGPLSARFGAKAVLVAGATTSIVTFALLAFAHAHIWEILLAMLLQGVGFGLAFASMSNLIVAAVPAHQTGVASGMNANIRTIGGSIGAAVMSSIVTSSLRPDGIPHEAGYTHGFIMITAVTVLAAVAALLVPKLRQTPRSTEPETAPHAELAMVAAGTVVGDESE